MNLETKDFPVTSGEPTSEHPYGTFEVILSAPTLDRDGEVVDARAFEPLPEHVSFDTDHSMTCDSVVGSGTPYYADDGTLRVSGGYCSDVRSQTIRQKVAEGHIRSTSVTFMAATREKDEKGIAHITSAELLNGTFTPIPSNRESVVLAAKSVLAADMKAGARNSAKDAQMIQAAHDAMVALGAICEDEASEDDPASGAPSKGLMGSVMEKAFAALASGVEPTELSTTDESAVPADETAAKAADPSAEATDEVPPEVKAALAARHTQLDVAFL